MHIDNLVPLFNVANVADSVHFYCDILGFEIVAQYPIEGEPVWANLAIGNHHLMLNQPDWVHSRGERRAHMDAMIFFHVDDAGVLHRDLRARGFEVSELDHETYGNEFRMRDPDGYELAFVSPRKP